MKILVISQYWYPENGVPQRRWQWLTQLLIAAGHEVTVVAPPPNYNVPLGHREVVRLNRKVVGLKSLGPSGETIIRSGFLPARNTLTSKAASQIIDAAGQLWQVLKLTRKQHDEFDLLIGTVPALPTALVTSVSAALLKTPFMVDLRDAWPDLLKSSAHWNRATERVAPMRVRISALGPLQLAKFLAAKSISYSLRHSDAVMVTTRGMKREIVSDPRNSKREEDVAVVRNVFPSASPTRKNSQRLKAENSLRVLYAGTAGRAQNLINALLAARLVVDAGISLELRIVGAGDARRNLEEFALKHNLNVIFEDVMPAYELKGYYSWADTALVHLTDWEPLSRTIPSKTYELMAQGIHITAVASGEVAGLISEMGAGHVVPPESPEALAHLWSELAAHPYLLEASEAGARWVKMQRENVVPRSFKRIIDRAVGYA